MELQLGLLGGREERVGGDVGYLSIYMHFT